MFTRQEKKALDKKVNLWFTSEHRGSMSWNDNKWFDDYEPDYENDSAPRMCHKCWDTYSNCDCEALRLKQDLADAKKEIKALKKLLKEKK